MNSKGMVSQKLISKNFLYFIERYKDQKFFSFFRHNPSDLLSLDKILRDKASQEGRNFNLPI